MKGFGWLLVICGLLWLLYLASTGALLR